MCVTAQLMLKPFNFSSVDTKVVVKRKKEGKAETDEFSFCCLSSEKQNLMEIYACFLSSKGIGKEKEKRGGYALLVSFSFFWVYSF